MTDAHREVGDSKEDFFERVETLFYDTKVNFVEAIECPVCKRLNVLAKDRLRLVFRRETLSVDTSANDGADLYAVLQEVNLGNETGDGK